MSYLRLTTHLMYKHDPPKNILDWVKFIMSFPFVLLFLMVCGAKDTILE